ncbi:MAG TPA: ABC transporter C-terminal domain-containing protein, partial [Chlamydiales bacterium]|nr:ABC transporter C-terminal domain-containing protein [Chlamydiales bacterium]
IFPDYAQWEAIQKTPASKSKEKKAELPHSERPKPKLSYQEKREYDAIEGKISKLEEEVRSLNHLLEEKEIAENPARLSEICTAIGLAETQIEQLYLRWEELSKKN